MYPVGYIKSGGSKRHIASDERGRRRREATLLKEVPMPVRYVGFRRSKASIWGGGVAALHRMTPRGRGVAANDTTRTVFAALFMGDPSRYPARYIDFAREKGINAGCRRRRNATNPHEGMQVFALKGFRRPEDSRTDVQGQSSLRPRSCGRMARPHVRRWVGAAPFAVDGRAPRSLHRGGPFRIRLGRSSFQAQGNDMRGRLRDGEHAKARDDEGRGDVHSA